MQKEDAVTGAKVRLIVGGPEMVVSFVDRNWINCQWFAGKKLESGRFQVDTLELIKPKEE
ncbi:hypothetical protein PSYAC_04668 [Pseudomonas syringae pv. actinidiae str. M302091]|uniref:DUF2158 domain-containing protein n=1 Tax=Pseudomonas syringae TaxID=317 RepID=UPI0002090D0B|nr:DUF2158 domain-containing protein [Pseudomonas syringae]EGH64190.1 hypothetical protein PSYAC_04668 [Pseudomonas syringae pv. actinidiae str. M302091]NVL45922.1 DUF2158 domain-containing protein [Pseudomonas syringae pv. actinidiae]